MALRRLQNHHQSTLPGVVCNNKVVKEVCQKELNRLMHPLSRYYHASSRWYRQRFSITALHLNNPVIKATMQQLSGRRLSPVSIISHQRPNKGPRLPRKRSHQNHRHVLSANRRHPGQRPLCLHLNRPPPNNHPHHKVDIITFSHPHQHRTINHPHQTHLLRHSRISSHQRLEHHRIINRPHQIQIYSNSP